METPIKEQPQWGMHSTAYWITLLLALGIIFIGIRFILQPQIGAVGYGIAFSNDHNAVYGLVKGIRDIFSGIVLLPLLIMRMRKATAWVFAAATVVPLGDFLLIAATNGSADLEHLLVHGLTALIMIINCFLLFAKRSR